jgi:short subunit dehydrogenase-like uncharacterized protein
MANTFLLYGATGYVGEAMARACGFEVFKGSESLNESLKAKAPAHG